MVNFQLLIFDLVNLIKFDPAEQKEKFHRETKIQSLISYFIFAPTLSPVACDPIRGTIRSPPPTNDPCIWPHQDIWKGTLILFKK